MFVNSKFDWGRYNKYQLIRRPAEVKTRAILRGETNRYAYINCTFSVLCATMFLDNIIHIQSIWERIYLNIINDEDGVWCKYCEFVLWQKKITLTPKKREPCFGLQFQTNPNMRQVDWFKNHCCLLLNSVVFPKIWVSKYSNGDKQTFLYGYSLWRSPFWRLTINVQHPF